jgi:hypothetical protein
LTPLSGCPAFSTTPDTCKATPVNCWHSMKWY